MIGEVGVDDEELAERGEELILLGERMRLVNEPSLIELICAAGEGGIGKDGGDEGFVFNSSTTSSVAATAAAVVVVVVAQGAVGSNLSSLIGRDSNLEVYADVEMGGKDDRRTVLLFYGW